MFSKLFSSKSEETSIGWNSLTSHEELDKIEELSREKAVVIFKHSTRCGISAMALNRFERDFAEDAHFLPYYLDLIAYREISNEVANRFNVQHQSPQTLLIVGGKAVYSASHNGIDYHELNHIAASHIR